ncbi:molybdenum ABC transporter ATP-binding protein [Methylomarinum sp. Ch1-1]|uniref:Molybdenum ABC transporter ATP-binding protein n=1 Tax=Methylomarinum roseum TaxID=3067653 RepID=A0AAU7NS09_9GAMM
MTTLDTIKACLKLDYSGFSLDVDLNLPGKGVTALFGHSGSGKTTLLRCIAGLERAVGSLSVNGSTWQNDKLFLPTHKRPLGYVFQEANLFPHLSVQGNLQYGLKRAMSNGRQFSLEQAIDLLDIGHLLHRKTTRLSGGERQRVAIARALTVNPRVLLMDEPLASLDQLRKREILPFLQRLRDELDIPILYVTHASDEVARLADHVVILSKGQVVASGSLTETLARIDLPVRPDEDASVVLKARIAEQDHRWGLARAEFAGGSLWLRDMGFDIGETVRLQIMARDVSLAREQPTTPSSIVNLLPATIEEIGAGEHPAIKQIRLLAGESPLLCRLTSRSADALGLKIGQSVWAQIKSAAIIE